MFANFYKSFKRRLLNKISRKSTENVCEQWEITKPNTRIILLIFDDTSYFLYLFLNWLVYCRIFVTILSRCYLKIFKNLFSKPNRPLKWMILKVDFALKLSNYTLLKRFICLKWILKFLHNTRLSVQLRWHCRSLPLSI